MMITLKEMIVRLKLNFPEEFGDEQQIYEEIMAETRRQVHRDKKVIEEIMREPSRGKRLQMMWSALRYEPSYPPIEEQE